MNHSSQTVPSRGNRISWLGVMSPLDLLVIFYHQHQQQLAAADLRTLNHQWAAFAQVRVGLKQDIIFFIELEVQGVTGVVLAASVGLQSKILAVGQPVFLTRLERLVRLANQLELIVAKKFF